jgi:hypoxanthine phosphoribosyltransferase
MSRHTLHILYPRDQIADRVRSLAERISEDYKGRVPILVAVLKGAVVFLADLMRQLTIPVQLDFVRLASYGDAMESKGVISITKDLEMPVQGRDLLVVEDIVDSGRTLKFLLEDLQRRGARSVRCCVLLDKRHRREVQIAVDYVGFVMEEGFVVGYGLDWSEDFRHLPDIFIVQVAEGASASRGG